MVLGVDIVPEAMGSGILMGIQASPHLQMSLHYSYRKTCFEKISLQNHSIVTGADHDSVVFPISIRCHRFHLLY